MDEQTARDAPAVEFGRALKGFGINLLVRDVTRSVGFLEQILGMRVHRADADFAVLESAGHFIQLHADHTYHSNPLPSLLPKAGARGAGIELRLYGIDPDACEAKAIAGAHVVLRTSENRPHGLRECYLLDPDGYCWVPGIAVKDTPD